MKKSVALIVLALMSAAEALASVNLTPASGGANGLSWSMGQLGAATFRSTSGATVMTQGILQAPAVAYASIAEIGVAPDIELTVDSSHITISSDADVEWSLHDSAGRRLGTGSTKTIDIGGYAQGVYILKLSRANGKTIFKKILKR